jgi:hypothetical protein
MACTDTETPESQRTDLAYMLKNEARLELYKRQLSIIVLISSCTADYGRNDVRMARKKSTPDNHVGSRQNHVRRDGTMSFGFGNTPCIATANRIGVEQAWR